MTKLKRLRMIQKLRLSAVGCRLEVKRSIIAGWESDSSADLDNPVGQVKILAALYKVHPSVFFTDVPKYGPMLKSDWCFLYRNYFRLRRLYRALCYKVKSIF